MPAGAFDALAGRQELPDAEIRDGALKVTPVHSAIPAAAEALNEGQKSR